VLNITLNQDAFSYFEDKHTNRKDDICDLTRFRQVTLNDRERVMHSCFVKYEQFNLTSQEINAFCLGLIPMRSTTYITPMVIQIDMVRICPTNNIEKSRYNSSETVI
jgi:hypothetical protein